MKESDICYLDSSVKNHEIVGYSLYHDEIYKFYSIEDGYTNPILYHWTSFIVKNYDNETCWLLVKEHPCKLYGVMTNIYKGAYTCIVENFDIWKTEEKNGLVAVVTHIDID
jgi:hypothetical protein